jgi:CubicO group peptidase (beta-lactamase class C family)
MVILVGLIVIFFAGMFIAMSIFNSPMYAWRILRYAQSDIGDTAIFPERPIQNGTNYSLIERATGMHVAEYLQERFWKPMGAEFPASWSLDSESSGFEKMESGINARAIDFARFGLIFLHNGFWNGVQILPESWVRESTEPLRPDPRIWETFSYWTDYGSYYKYHWWGINNPDGTYDFYAHGRYDQLVYIAQRKNVVIVRLGDQLDENVMWPLVLHNMVD